MARLQSKSVGPMGGLQMAGPQADPLGISTQQRSTAGALQGVQAIPFGGDPMGIQRNAAMQSYQNSASDPQRFNTMMQSITENAPGGVQVPSRRGDPMPGVPTAPLGQPSTRWQPGQAGITSGRPFDPQQAFRGLQGAR